MVARILGILVSPTAVPIAALAQIVVPTHGGRNLVRAPAFRGLWRESGHLDIVQMKEPLVPLVGLG